MATVMHTLTYTLEDGTNTPVIDLLPFPVSTANDPRPVPRDNASDSNGHNTSRPFSITELCTLPPVELAKGAPPHLMEHLDGCTGRLPTTPIPGSIRQACLQRQGLILSLDAQCIWDALTAPNALESEPGWFCLPLDHPTLAKRGIVPVPVFANDTTSQLHQLLHTRAGSVLKHQLQARNHSAAALAAFANVPVRPGHKRLRLGVCVPLPPTGAPCALDATNSSTGTVSDAWLFPVTGADEVADHDWLHLALAHPVAAFSRMMGPHLGNLDALAHDAAPPPFPFITFAANQQATFYGRRFTARAWAIPLVACTPTNTTSEVGFGTIRPLIVNGPCFTGRDCLSGVCSFFRCDNAIKQETRSPFSPMFRLDSSRPLTFPASTTLRQVLDVQDTWNAEYVFMMGVIGAASASALFGIVVGMWLTSARRYLIVWTVGWRTSTERDLALKPVSGAMVAEIGNEETVPEAELPTYVEPRER